MSGLIEASVNTRWLGKWDKQDVLRFIKVYQDREAFEGNKVVQFDAMNNIINRKLLSGKQFEHINSTQQLTKLFEYKISLKTANVLLNGLNMERSMFQQKELSKSIINKNK